MSESCTDAVSSTYREFIAFFGYDPVVKIIPKQVVHPVHDGQIRPIDQQACVVGYSNSESDRAAGLPMSVKSFGYYWIDQ